MGVESQTIEPDGGNGAVHRQLLGENVIVLEGIDLTCVTPGVYFLFVAPLKIAGAEGTPVRAVLLERKM